MDLPEELHSVKFAECFESVKMLYLSDDYFKIICDEYCLRKKMAENYKIKLIKHLRRIALFENLSKELEEEILIYIIRNEQF